MEIIANYFPELTQKQYLQFKQAEELYRHWNEKINVISRKDINHLAIHHFLHSLAIAKVYAFESGACVMDLGTGGGFPGIPLAILFPETEFLLVDSIAKKIKVATEIAQELQLYNVRTSQIRAEELTQSFDFVVSRAVTQMPILKQWLKGKLKNTSKFNYNNGIFCLKGGELTQELKDFKHAEIYNLSDFFSEDFFQTKKVIYIDGKYL